MVIEIQAPAEDEEVDMIDLFILEGVTYKIPNKVRPNVSMKYLWLIQQSGAALADAWLGEQLLGTDGYVAYLNCKYMTQEVSDQIYEAARQVVFGEKRPKSESTSPTSTSTPRRSRASTTKSSNGSRTRKPPSKATSADTTE